MIADFNVARRFPANRIGRHGDTRQIILIDIGWRVVCVTYITKNSAKVDNFLANLARSHVFSLRRSLGERATESWRRDFQDMVHHSSCVHHDVRGVRAESIRVTSPVRVQPPPKGINNRVVTRETQRFIESSTEIT